MNLASILVALKYRAKIITVVQTIEAMVPDDYPGTKKLDLALKALIRWDAKIQGVLPEVADIIAGVKAVYNEVKAAGAAELQAP